MKKILLALVSFAFFGCPAGAVPSPKCETPDSGTPVIQSMDSGMVDAGPAKNDFTFRFVNLGREDVTLMFEGEDGGEPVRPLETATRQYIGSVTIVKATVLANSYLDDAGIQPVSFPIELDAASKEPTYSYVLSDLTPTRTSMTPTVGKQSQGVNFGDRVMAGLAGVQIEGGVDTGGTCDADIGGTAGMAPGISIRTPSEMNCENAARKFFRVKQNDSKAASSPYFIQGDTGEVELAIVPDSNGGGLGVGRKMQRAVSVVRAQRDLYILNAHNNRQPATVSIGSTVLATDIPAGTLYKVPSNVAGASWLNGLPPGEPVFLNGLPPGGEPVIRGQKMTTTVGGMTQTLNIAEWSWGVSNPQSRIYTGPCKPPYLCDFANDESVLLVVSENPNSSATVLRQVNKSKSNVKNNRAVFASTAMIETLGCVSLNLSDDTCAIGPASVDALSAGSSMVSGGASSAAYARRMLFPPANPPAAGTTMRFGIKENGAAARVIWDSPAGLTPAAGKQVEGFAIVAPGTALDLQAMPTKRSLFFVDTTTNPWTLNSTLSK
jgi:hypothetical protein